MRRTTNTDDQLCCRSYKKRAQRLSVSYSREQPIFWMSPCERRGFRRFDVQAHMLRGVMLPKEWKSYGSWLKTQTDSEQPKHGDWNG